MMEARQRNYFIAGGMVLLAGLAFMTGREVESRRASHRATIPVASEKPEATSPTPTPPAFDAPDIANLPFSDLYEQLRFSSFETRLGMAERIMAMPDGPAKDAARFAYCKLIAQIAPADAVTDMLDSAADRQVVRTILAATPPSALGLFAEAVLKLPTAGDSGLSRVMAISDVMDRWSQVDPEATCQFLEKNYTGVDFAAMAQYAVQNWAAMDPQAAMEWIVKVDPSRADWSLEGSLLDGWFQYDRTAAMDYAVAHAAEEGFSFKNRNFADTIFCASPEEARAFINRLPIDQQKAAVEEIGSVYRADGPNPPPRELAEWLMQFPPELWEKPISHAVIDWSSENAPEFFSWAAGLPAETQDKIATAYSDRYQPQPEDIEKFIRIAATAPAPQLREKLVHQLVSRYGSMLKENVEFVEQLPISSAEKNALHMLIPKQ